MNSKLEQEERIYQLLDKRLNHVAHRGVVPNFIILMFES